MKKTKIFFPSRTKLCALYNTLYQTVGSRVFQSYSRQLACESVGLMIPLQHRLSPQRWGDGINMWPNAALTYNHPLDGLGFFWNLGNGDKMILDI